MKERYIYLRDKDKRPLVTMCLAQTQDGKIGRGLAICSPSDNPCKKIGRSIAKDRAADALLSKETGLPVNKKDVCYLLVKVGGKFPVSSLSRKSAFNPELSDFEKKILA